MKSDYESGGREFESSPARHFSLFSLASVQSILAHAAGGRSPLRTLRVRSWLAKARYFSSSSLTSVRSGATLALSDGTDHRKPSRSRAGAFDASRSRRLLSDLQTFRARLQLKRGGSCPALSGFSQVRVDGAPARLSAPATGRDSRHAQFERRFEGRGCFCRTGRSRLRSICGRSWRKACRSWLRSSRGAGFGPPP